MTLRTDLFDLAHKAFPGEVFVTVDERFVREEG